MIIFEEGQTVEKPANSTSIPVKFKIPESWLSFLGVAGLWLLLCIPGLQEFLGEYSLLNLVYWGFAFGVFAAFGMVLNEIDTKLGVKDASDWECSGIILFISIGLATLITYETTQFGKDFEGLYVYIRYLFMVLWFLAILISLTMAPCFLFRLDDVSAVRFLASHQIRFPENLQNTADALLKALELELQPAASQRKDPSGRISQRGLRRIWNKQHRNFHEGQAKVAESTSNVDTYTLEAALFGGLAFSSIVSIISSDKYKHEDFAAFLRSLVDGVSSLRSFQIETLRQLFSGPTGETDWLILFLLLLSIFSTAFFLASLFCRIPFSRAHRDCKVAYEAIGRDLSGFRKRIGERFVEQPIFNRHLKRKERISMNLTEAEGKYDEIESIMNIMRVFRILGLLSVCLMLVGVCARVEPYFGWLVAFLIAIGFSNMMGNPMALLLGRLRKAYSIRKYPRKNF